MKYLKTPLDVATQIEATIVKLGEEGNKSEELIQAKAQATGDYDRLMGVAVADLKAKGEPITIIDKLAKERTYKARIAMIIAEESLKAHYSKLERLEAVLNGFQSINRYFSTTNISG